MKVTDELVLIDDIDNLIESCYSLDNELILNNHVLSPTTLSDAINHTSNLLKIDINKGLLSVYKILVDSELLGYYGVHRLVDLESIVGFFIVPKFREKIYIEQFWKLLLSKFRSDIYIGLYQKNTKAIAFIKKKNFIFVGTEYDISEYQNYDIFVLKK